MHAEVVFLPTQRTEEVSPGDKAGEDNSITLGYCLSMLFSSLRPGAAP